MSSAEPLWFCHECNAEMRPLMMPHPVCASCRSDFVEKMEDPNDDPRDFTHGHDDSNGEGITPGVETFLYGLQQLLDRGIAERGSQIPRTAPRSPNMGNSFSFQIHTGPGLRDSPERPPTMSEFLRGSNGAAAGGTITGPLMAQYLMALLGHRPGDDFMGRMGFGDPATYGRMGDYVFNQEALDQIITQLMNESNANRPVPAPEDLISKLPKEILESKSPTLDKDCAVCKEQFKLETEDPAEQIVITLPCKHPFHEPCIIPWLKSSGTCPVCRHALVPQPEHSPPNVASGSNPRPASPQARQNRSSGQQHEAPSIFQSLFGGLVGGGRSSTSNPSTHNRSNSDPTGSRNRRNDHLPGSWEDDLD